MDRSKLDPEMRKVYEELDTLDFKVSMARDVDGMYSDDEVAAMGDDYPQRLAEVARRLQERFDALPEEVKRRARYEVHHNRDMSDVREWIEHTQDNLDWLKDRSGGGAR